VTSETKTGPLAGTTVIELAGIGPGPLAGMILADLGADVIRVDRPGKAGLDFGDYYRGDVVNRGKRSVAVDLKNAAGRDLVLALVEKADVLIEGNRPGVTERLGLGPEDCWARNPTLVYGRMTGWGQQGPLSQVAGHDIGYLALTGALWAIGRADEAPTPPLNLAADYAGGTMFLVTGVLAALLEAGRSGKGQVVDAAMVDGAAVLMTMFHAFRAMGIWDEARGTNLLDTGAHFYDVYETADGKYVSIGSIEPQFYAELLRLTGLEGEELPWQHDKGHWPALKERLAAIFKAKTRDEWCAVMEGTDVCFAPVLSLSEAPQHPHNVHRGTFLDLEGVVQPAPAPRFSGTPASVQRPPAHAGQHTDEVLAEWGFDADRVAKLRDAGAVA